MPTRTTQSCCSAACRPPPTPPRTRGTRRAAGGRISSALAVRSTPTSSMSYAQTISVVATAPAAPRRVTRRVEGMAAASRVLRYSTRLRRSSRSWTTSASTSSTPASAPRWAACRASARPRVSLIAWASLCQSRPAPRASRGASPSGTRSARPSCRTRTGAAATTTTARCRPLACGWRASWAPSPTARAASGSSASASAGPRPRPRASAVSLRSSATSCTRVRSGSTTTTQTPCSGSPRQWTASQWSARTPMASPR
mmetsp:Transcript_44703/g.127577  ORF Transcript_44703/g.127577 Transcript_44703/m.127577 type:complete len:256 (+) Transcript_44703:272-1039(+)